ncbi:MAG: vWA domain-containing protein [Clostridium sp.]
MKTDLIFILDRSGSMSGLEGDTIGGYNSMINKQKQEEGEAFITTVLFDNDYEVLHNRVELKNLGKITEDDYYVRGCTALLDAIGKTIMKVSHKQYKLKENRADKVVFVITTDGMENASREFTYEKIREMIKVQKEEFGWEFIFMGANIDAEETAKQFSIDEDRAVNFHADSEGILLNYEVIGDVLSDVRGNRNIDGRWKERIEKDYKNRNSNNDRRRRRG